MSFKSIDSILGALEKQAQFQQLQQFRRVVASWSEVVGVAVASHTKPIAISRNVLRVAASSSAWSQTLTLERSRILKKLNPLLPEPLSDIRFSVAQWQNISNSKPSGDAIEPTSSPETSSRQQQTSMPVVKREAAKDPQAAFASWAQNLQKRSQYLPLCSQCQCHTPLAELERWGICAFCQCKQER
jgi:predicted nucleic acid-binding Zn ribbon protein